MSPNEGGAALLARIQRNAALLALVLAGGVGLAVDALYSIIVLGSAALSVAGFHIMMKTVDRLLRRSRGKVLFFALEIGKLAVVSATFVLTARISDGAALSYFLGISVIVLAIMGEGARLVWRSVFHGA